MVGGICRAVEWSYTASRVSTGVPGNRCIRRLRMWGLVRESVVPTAVA